MSSYNTAYHNGTDPNNSHIFDYLQIISAYLSFGNIFLIFLLIIMITSYLTRRYDMQPTKLLFKRYITLFLLQVFIVILLANPYTNFIAAMFVLSQYSIYLTIIFTKRKALIIVLRRKILSESDDTARIQYQLALNRFTCLSRIIIPFIVLIAVFNTLNLLNNILRDIFVRNYFPICPMCADSILPNSITSSNIFVDIQSIIEIEERYVTISMTTLGILTAMFPLPIGYAINSIHNTYFKKHQYKFNYDTLQPLLKR